MLRLFLARVCFIFSSHRQSSTGSVVVTTTCATSPLSQITSEKNWRSRAAAHDYDGRVKEELAEHEEKELSAHIDKGKNLDRKEMAQVKDISKKIRHESERTKN